MKKRLYVAIFLVGITMGVFWGMTKVKASSPVNESSGGEDTASVYYDESWKAERALVSSPTAGYYDADISNNGDTSTSAQMQGGSNVFPKMVVTRWKVHGHIHFQ